MKTKTQSKYNVKWIFAKTKGTRFHLSLYAFLVIVAAVLTIIFAFFLKSFVDIATGDSDESLLTIAIYSIGVVFAVGVITVVNSVLAQYIVGKTERNLRVDLMNVILTRKLLDISKQHTGELMTKLTVDVQAVSICFKSLVEKLMGGIITALIAAVSIFLLNWKIALVMLILTPILMLVTSIFLPRMQRISEIDKSNEEANRGIMQEKLSRIMLIKAYFMQSKVVSKVHKAYAAKLKSGMKLGMWEGLIAFSGSVISMVMFITIIGIGSYFVLRGETTVGSLIAIVQLLNYIVMPLEGVAQAVTQIGQSLASSGRIGEICELPADNELTATKSINAVELIAENISFAYEDDNVLENVNATFAKGEITGIIGKSGCGKSTLLKLLIGLYEPKQGEITLKTTAGLTTEIMPQVAYVPPVDYLFFGTVTENIIMSEDEPIVSDMKKAASNANILDFIESLANGFATTIGESGGTVSSGQAQRLAIARAIYKKSPIVVFDEPTANLDVDSIEKFQSVVKRIARDKICIIVTHDESTVGVCDRVYVLENGCVK